MRSGAEFSAPCSCLTVVAAEATLTGAGAGAGAEVGAGAGPGTGQGAGPGPAVTAVQTPGSVFTGAAEKHRGLMFVSSSLILGFPMSLY